jgi:hypothetical protein
MRFFNFETAAYFGVIILLSLFTQASEVEWHYPELGEKIKNSSLIPVTISGFVRKDAQVRVNSKRISYISKDNKLIFLSPKSVVGGHQLHLKSGETFYFNFLLPEGKIQIQLRFAYTNKKTESFQISLAVTPQQVRFENTFTTELLPKQWEHGALVLGGGWVQSQLEQKMGDLSNLSFEFSSGPTLFLENKLAINSNQTLVFSWKKLTGTIKSGEDVLVYKNDFYWQNYSLDWEYSFGKNDNGLLYNRNRTKWGILLGLEYTQSPLLQRTERVGQSSYVEIINVDAYGARIGFQLLKNFSRNLFSHFSISYSHPFYSSQEVDLEGIYQYDMKFDFYYKFSRLLFGVGLSNKTSLTKMNLEDLSTGESEKNSRSINYSLIDFLIGYTY